MDLRKLRCGDEVAVLPSSEAAPELVIEVVVIDQIGPNLLHLSDGRYYVAATGRGLNNSTFITSATQEHRAVLIARSATPEQPNGQ
jgi:hypothetical protein